MKLDDELKSEFVTIRRELAALTAYMERLYRGVRSDQHRLDTLERREASREQQKNALQSFAMQNSSVLKDVPMRRLFPVVLYLPNVSANNHTAQDSYSQAAREMLTELGFEVAYEFPYIFGGSGLLTIFGSSKEPSVFEDFWKDHPAIDVVTTMLHRIGGAGGVVALVGLLYFGPTGKPKAVSPEAAKQIVIVVNQAADANEGKVLLQDGLGRAKHHRRFLSAVQSSKRKKLETPSHGSPAQ